MRIRKYRYLWLILVPALIVALYFGRSQLPQEILPSVLQADPDPVCIELHDFLEGGSVRYDTGWVGGQVYFRLNGDGEAVKVRVRVYDGDSEAVELCLNESSGEK